MYSFEHHHPHRCLGRLRQDASGFTLIELLIVVAVLGALLTLAVPAYSALTGRASFKVAEHQLRSAMPLAEAFHLDNDTYVGLGNKAKKTPPGLVFYDPTIKVKVGTGKGKPTATTYCLNATLGGKTLSASGPGPTVWYQKTNCAGTGAATAP